MASRAARSGRGACGGRRASSRFVVFVVFLSLCVDGVTWRAAGAGFSAVPRPQAVAALHWLSRFAALWSWNAAMEDVTSDAIGALVAADDELWL